MQSKTNQVKMALEINDFKKALQIAKGFRIGFTENDRSTLRRGYECIVRPDFYQQLGKVPEDEIQKAIKLLKEKQDG